MYDPAITSTTRKFYEHHPFPGNRPIDKDGLIFLRHLSASIRSRSGKAGGSGVRVLDAGCGTGNTSVALARQFRDTEFVGLDQSRASLEKARVLARRDNLTNVRFAQHDLMQPLPPGESFDIVLCLGVLHHLADMKRALSHLRHALKKRGELYLWVYGKYGRYLHSLNMRCLQLLIGPDTPPDDAIQLAAEFVKNARNGAPLKELIGKTPVEEIQKPAFGDPVWIADQFLNPREILIDMEELLGMVQDAHMELCEILGGTIDIAALLNSPRLHERYRLLDKRQQLIVTDLLLKPERYFVRLKVPEKE